MDSLIAAPASTAFTIVFDEVEGAPGGGPGLFIWRQGDGKRRWDELPVRGATQGSFLIEDGFAGSTSRFPARGRQCSWGAPVGRAPHIVCGESPGDVGLGGAIEFALISAGSVTEMPSRTIAGVSASCFSFALYQGAATLCVDELGSPLFFDGLDGGRVRHQITAASVSRAPAMGTLPINDLNAVFSTADSTTSSWDLPPALLEASGLRTQP